MIALYARDAFISTESKIDRTVKCDEMYIQTTQVVANARLYDPFTFISLSLSLSLSLRLTTHFLFYRDHKFYRAIQVYLATAKGRCIYAAIVISMSHTNLVAHTNSSNLYLYNNFIYIVNLFNDMFNSFININFLFNTEIKV